MSSFLVSDLTINRIISFLSYYGGWKGDRIKTMFKEEYDYDLINQDDLNLLGIAMLKMNTEALTQRYNDKEKNDISFKHEFVKTTIFQALKSLQCYLYQCMEGDICKRKFYLDLRKVQRNLESDIIDELPLYKEAEWD